MPSDPVVAVTRTKGHGLRTLDIVVASHELPGDWHDFHRDAVSALAPEGAVELALAQRVAELLWRLRRAAAAERDFIERAMDNDQIVTERKASYARDMRERLGPDSFYAPPESATGIVKPRPRMFPHDSEMQTVMRYEAHINRQLMHALHELEALQERRRGNRMPLARVDVHGLPGT